MKLFWVGLGIILFVAAAVFWLDQTSPTEAELGAVVTQAHQFQQNGTTPEVKEPQISTLATLKVVITSIIVVITIGLVSMLIQRFIRFMRVPTVGERRGWILNLSLFRDDIHRFGRR